MDLVLRGPQIHSSFGNLGFSHAEGYHINENCNETLESILRNILTEDKFLRSYRRSISFGQNIKKDLIPLLIHTNDDKTTELIIKILVNLTIPIECLLCVDQVSKTDFGRHCVFELNILLSAAKVAFTDLNATKAVINFLKKNMLVETQSVLSLEQRTNICNSLLLLRNILHIPEDNIINNAGSNNSGSTKSVQNQIIWNTFSQSIGKTLITLMTIPEAPDWAVTMVQLIALLYKDQHVVTLHNLLHVWFTAPLSESSEENESNTSPPDQGSEDSSPVLISSPTSDCSDIKDNGKTKAEQTAGDDAANDSRMPSDGQGLTGTEAANCLRNLNGSPEPASSDASKACQGKCPPDTATGTQNSSQVLKPSFTDAHMPREDVKPPGIDAPILSRNPETQPPQPQTKIEHLNNKTNACNYSLHKYAGSNNSKAATCTTDKKKRTIAENSDYGYGTQIEIYDSISTSSNDDVLPMQKPKHQKPQHPKKRPNNKPRVSGTNLQEWKRKKIFKRGRINILHLHQELSHTTPTDDDISNVLKDFTVDFLLKGYNSLVQTLHSQILCNRNLEIDTSHFFWLVTYFLKFATQIELGLEHLYSVLSYDIVSYLTAEAVNLCEQFELAIKLDGSDLKPCLRRLHLVVTAIREFVQAVEGYKKISHICKGIAATLSDLELKMCETDELRSLLVLLLRLYNPKYHKKQYLEDLIVTNHIMLLFVDGVMNLPEYSGSTNMLDHISQFSSPEIMAQYGLLLEDYTSNGDFVNDCIFTLMHHVGGSPEGLISLFQPNILKTFTAIWKSEFEICDDWADLIEHAINTFVKKPNRTESEVMFTMMAEDFEKSECVDMPSPSLPPVVSASTSSNKNRWTDDELSSLSWNYMQCQASIDVIGEIVKLFSEDGIDKTRYSVIKELLRQGTLQKKEYEIFVKLEDERATINIQANKEMTDDEMGKLCQQLVLDGNSKFLDWVQKVLLDTCYAKIYLEKKTKLEHDILNFDIFKIHSEEVTVISPVSYHSLILNQLVPLVPWNCEQAAICKDLKFLQLLHKLGFYMPVDSGKIFIRIPNFWTVDKLYEVAGKITTLPFKLDIPMNDLSDSTLENSKLNTSLLSDIKKEINLTEIKSENDVSHVLGLSIKSEKDETKAEMINWMDIVTKPEENDTFPNLESCETASVASDLTRMYVSDEDDKTDILPSSKVVTSILEEHKYSKSIKTASKIIPNVKLLQN